MESLICHFVYTNQPFANDPTGFKKQMSRFPLRFFVEQLGEHKQIVFTGMYM